MSTGSDILAAQAMGADLAYMGTRFIASKEANASSEYKLMLVESCAEDIVYSSLFTGVKGNYLRGSIAAAGLDPDQLPDGDISKIDFQEMVQGAKPGKTYGALVRVSGLLHRKFMSPGLLRSWLNNIKTRKRPFEIKRS